MMMAMMLMMMVIFSAKTRAGAAGENVKFGGVHHLDHLEL
jgi:hypothetical protein